MKAYTRRGMVTIGLVASVAAWRAVATPLELLRPPSRMWVAGTSTVRDFECQVPVFEALVDAEAPNAAALLVAGQKVITTADVTVPAEQLDCKNATMNKHMRNALKAAEYPVIAFRMKSYDVTTDSGRTRVVIAGDLSLGGSTKAISVTGDAQAEGSDVLRVRGTHEIRMSDFGLKPPTLFFGTLKVGQRVTVGFDLALKG